MNGIKQTQSTDGIQEVMEWEGYYVSYLDNSASAAMNHADHVTSLSLRHIWHLIADKIAIPCLKPSDRPNDDNTSSIYV